VFVFDADAVCPWVVEKAGGVYTHVCRGVGVEKDGALKVGVMYNGFTGEGGSIFMHWRCDDPKATSKTFYWVAFDYPFNQLGVNVVYGVVHAKNVHAIEIDERLGFKREHTLPGYFPDGDAVLYSMKREHCRWIKRREGALESKDYGQKISSAHAA
jgi:hypothetical protein